MTGLSRECRRVWACRPVRYCFVVRVRKFPPSPNLAGTADEAAMVSWVPCSPGHLYWCYWQPYEMAASLPTLMEGICHSSQSSWSRCPLLLRASLPAGDCFPLKVVKGKHTVWWRYFWL